MRRKNDKRIKKHLYVMMEEIIERNELIDKMIFIINEIIF